MRHVDIRRMLGATVAAGALSLAACSGAAQPQGRGVGGMMEGADGYHWMGGYGGPWMLIVVVVIVGLVAWMVSRGRTKR